MPSGLENTAMLACSTLSNPNTKPTIIIVDALNQVRFNESHFKSITAYFPFLCDSRAFYIFCSLMKSFQQHKSPGSLGNWHHKSVVCLV